MAVLIPFPSNLRIPFCTQRNLHPRLSRLEQLGADILWFERFKRNDPDNNGFLSSRLLGGPTGWEGAETPSSASKGFPSALPREEGRDKGQGFSSPISPAPKGIA